ncbi:MAG TPA: hypothetical protein VIJ89_06325 [Deferrimonas sp.]
MKGKKLLTGFLLVFVVASIGYLLVKESRRGSLAGSSPSGEAVASSEGSVTSSTIITSRASRW